LIFSECTLNSIIRNGKDKREITNKFIFTAAKKLEISINYYCQEIKFWCKGLLKMIRYEAVSIIYETINSEVIDILLEEQYFFMII